MFGECHAHVIMDGINYRAAVNLHRDGVKEEVIHRCFEAYRASGISFIRDGGDSLGVSARAKQLAENYGLDYRTPLFAIHKKGHYGGIVGRAFINMREYHGLVKEVMADGGDFIKIMVSGLIDFTEYGKLSEEGLPSEEIHEMVHIAREEGMAVMVHCNGARTMEAAADAGADSIEHGAYSDHDALCALKENGCIWTPTFSPAANMIGCGRFPDEVLLQLKENHTGRVREFVQMGGRVAVGSDAGAYRVPHVKGLETEISCLRPIVSEEHLKETECLIRKKFQRT
ncbi:MAG: amidohydrolase family protein [Lachnospiraceae bacterium]